VRAVAVANRFVLGTPKYDNGFDQLYFQGLSPLEALEKWRDYAPEN
jgi:hypothetical protein